MTSNNAPILTQSSSPECEVCGEPATNFLRDSYTETTIEGFKHFSPCGFIHGFCDEHARESEEIRIDSLFHPRSIKDVR